ncbi:MAG: hypothetical protein KatS3mg121_1357 [Gammaproteobacteria bacterium]|nr:MAG: hypothetical protein KatS3mg121_1357 [Gammaproteobacteria bacterium]
MAGVVRDGAAALRAGLPRPQRRWRRRFFAGARWLHWYSAMLLFASTAFFAATGLLLNHRDWLGRGERIEAEWPLPPPLAAELAAAPRLSGAPALGQAARWLEARLDLRAPREVRIDEALREAAFDYKAPAGYLSVRLDAAAGRVEVLGRRGGALAQLAALHQGRDSGRAWAWLIDLSAVGMLVFSLAGAVLVFQSRSQLRSALWASAAGLLTPLVIWLCWVPRLGGVEAGG